MDILSECAFIPRWEEHLQESKLQGVFDAKCNKFNSFTHILSLKFQTVNNLSCLKWTKTRTASFKGKYYHCQSLDHVRYLQYLQLYVCVQSEQVHITSL